MSTPSGGQIPLSHHDQELVVVEVGGGIRSYERDGRSIIDGYAATEMCPSGRGQLLAPWPNRLADGRFDWRGRTHQTPLSEPEHHNAIHGLVRWASWDVSAEAPGAVTLRHTLRPQPGWPWELSLAVRYQLEDHGLAVRTVVANASDEPCPLGVGWHPYAAAFGGLVDDVSLRLPAATAYKSDGRGLPIGRGDVTGTEFDYRDGKRIGAAVLDTAFTDLQRDSGGRADVEISDGRGRGTRLWMDGRFTHVMVYSGDTLGDVRRRRRGLAIEPMTCAPNMLRSGDGLIELAPGEVFEASWGLEPFSF